MIRASSLGVILVTALLTTGPAGSPAVGAPAQADNPWLERRILHVAHQGGEIEAPSNTLFAFKTAVDKGADVLEMDAHATADGEIVVLHDDTVDRTTDGNGRVDALTLAEIKGLDAAYWFVPDCGTCHDRADGDYSYRGFATGQRPIPPELGEFEPNDFRIPTLREVLETFPDTYLNIEINATFPDTAPYEQAVADLLAEFGRTDDLIIASFSDLAIERFKLLAPEVSTSPGMAQVGLFWASAQGPLPGLPNPRYHALQVPIEFEGNQVVTEDFVAKAHANDLAVHVWTINDRAEMEWLIDIGVDGIMTDRPTLLAQVLAERGSGSG